jgi:hypothetical protein
MALAHHTPTLIRCRPLQRRPRARPRGQQGAVPAPRPRDRGAPRARLGAVRGAARGGRGDGAAGSRARGARRGGGSAGAGGHSLLRPGRQAHRGAGAGFAPWACALSFAPPHPARTKSAARAWTGKRAPAFGRGCARCAPCRRAQPPLPPPRRAPRAPAPRRCRRARRGRRRGRATTSHAHARQQAPALALRRARGARPLGPQTMRWPHGWAT